MFSEHQRARVTPRSAQNTLRADPPSVRKLNTAPNVYDAAPTPCSSLSPRPAPQRIRLLSRPVCPTSPIAPRHLLTPLLPLPPPPPPPSHHSPTQRHHRHRRHRHHHPCSARPSPLSLLHDSALWPNRLPAPRSPLRAPSYQLPTPVSALRARRRATMLHAHNIRSRPRRPSRGHASPPISARAQR